MKNTQISDKVKKRKYPNLRNVQKKMIKRIKDDLKGEALTRSIYRE